MLSQVPRFHSSYGWVIFHCGASLSSLVVKNLLTMQEPQEMWVWSLGWEHPLEKGMANYSSILDWRIPWTEEAGGLQSMGSQRVGHDWSYLACIIPYRYRYRWYMYIISLAFNLWMGPLDASISWLFKIMLLQTLGCTYLFKLMFSFFKVFTGTKAIT